MIDLINATQCLNLLKQDGIKYSKSYFSQMVTDGKIPYHSKEGSPKKFFKYDEVKASIEVTKDPTRDAQREANEKKRESDSCDLLSQAGKYESVADMGSDERKEYDKAQREAAEAKRAALEAGCDDIPPNNSSVNVSLNDAKTEKEYWLGQKAMLEVKKMQRELISLADAKASVEFIFAPINNRLDEIPQRMRANFADFSELQYQWLVDYINRMKEDLDLNVVAG